MNREINKEDLLFSLPDYINGKLEDSALAESIRNEIENNPEFRSEYESLKSTLAGFNKFELAEPPSGYFNNLLPSINDKIYGKEKKPVLSVFLSLFWKIAVPAATVLIVFFGYKTFIIDKEYSNLIKTDTPSVLQNDYQTSPNTTELAEQIKTEETEDESDDIYDYENILDLFSNQDGIKTSNRLNPDYSNVKNNSVQIDLSDNSQDEETFFSNDDESNFEQIFDKMDKKEQNEILEKLKSSKL